MDEARRAELNARREALIEEKRRQAFAADRADYVRMVPILAAMEAAGEEYDSHDYRRLRGVLNDWAHDPHGAAVQEESHAPLRFDPDACNAAILACLRARLGEDDEVTVILRREAMVLTLRMSVLARHMRTLVDNAMGDRLAFAAPPADWIVIVFRSEAIPASEIVTGALARETPL